MPNIKQPDGSTKFVGSVREHVLDAVVPDLIGAFLYYDRKEDEDLPRGEIEAAVETGALTVDDIVERFRVELVQGLGR